MKDTQAHTQNDESFGLFSILGLQSKAEIEFVDLLAMLQH